MPGVSSPPAESPRGLWPRPVGRPPAREGSKDMSNNKMLIDATHPEETRVVVLHGAA